MSPRKTPRRRIPILIGAAAVIVVMLGVQSRPSEKVSGRPPVLVPRTSAANAPARTIDATDSKTADLLPSDPTKTPAPSAEIPFAPPAEVEGSVHALSAWLLALPDAELKRSLGTPSLDRWVARVIDGFIALRGGEPGSVEITAFLEQLNARILAVQS